MYVSKSQLDFGQSPLCTSSKKSKEAWLKSLIISLLTHNYQKVTPYENFILHGFGRGPFRLL